MTNPDLDGKQLRPHRRSMRAAIAGLCALASIGAASSAFAPAASANPVKPPLNCADDPDQDGCPHDGGPSGGAGRTFLTASEVTWSGYMTDTSDPDWLVFLDVAFNGDEWDSWTDFTNAVETYFDVQTDFSTGCLFSAGTCRMTQRWDNVLQEYQFGVHTKH